MLKIDLNRFAGELHVKNERKRRVQCEFKYFNCLSSPKSIDLLFTEIEKFSKLTGYGGISEFDLCYVM